MVVRKITIDNSVKNIQQTKERVIKPNTKTIHFLVN